LYGVEAVFFLKASRPDVRPRRRKDRRVSGRWTMLARGDLTSGLVIGGMKGRDVGRRRRPGWGRGIFCMQGAFSSTDLLRNGGALRRKARFKKEREKVWKRRA